MTDEAFLFDCDGALLTGVLSLPDATVCSARVGVLVVVGGPQYRVGSHRQFVLLARELAANGVPCMRFDYRGMGDAQGDAVTFDNTASDISAAMDTFQLRVPELSGFVLWGLCDAASAISFYAPLDARVKGLVLLNPWVRTESGEATTYLKHYYLRRVLDPAFWKKLVSGGVSFGASVGGLLGTVKRTKQLAPAQSGALPDRMRQGLQEAGKPVLFVLSGRDFVADEFRAQVKADRAWQALINAGELVQVEEADHTFSSAKWRFKVAMATLAWLGRTGLR